MDKVEDFTVLEGLTKEKLIKLRDVAWQDFERQASARQESWLRFLQIVEALENMKRKGRNNNA